MNSGMRLTAAVIALVVIATGIYYASLGSDENRPSPVTLAEADTEGAPASKDATEPTPAAAPVEVREPTAEASETPASTRPPAPAEPTPAMETPAPGDSKADDDSTSESLVADSSTVPEAAADDPSASVVDGSDARTGADPGRTPASTTPVSPTPTDAAEPRAPVTEAPGIEAAGTENPATSMPADEASEESEPEIEDPNLDSGVDATTGSTAPSAAASGSDIPASSSRRPGRAIDAPGLGGHILVSSDAPADVLNPAARAFGEADSSLVVIPVDDHHAWLALPSDLQGSAILESVVVANRNDSGMQFVLVRGDLEGSLTLGGRIADAETTSFPGTDRYRVRYRVNQDQIDSVRKDSTILIGKPVAWVVDGGVVAISRPRIAISQRSMLPISTDESTATRLATLIVGGTESSSGGSLEIEKVSVTSPSGESEEVVVTGRPARAGELPRDAYTIYTIKPSDTPSSIAQWWFGDANKYSLILHANPLVDPNNMKVGDELRLPPKDFELITIIDVGDGKQPVVHIVQSGENLSAIAQAAYGDASLWPRIYEANKDKIKDPSRLNVGTELIIP